MVTISVTPFRRAIPMYVAPAALVQPILPPMPPGYRVSSSFWLYSVSDLRAVTGKFAIRVASYPISAGMASACRAMSARS